jgi:hypothetical protein
MTLVGWFMGGLRNLAKSSVIAVESDIEQGCTSASWLESTTSDNEVWEPPLACTYVVMTCPRHSCPITCKYWQCGVSYLPVVHLSGRHTSLHPALSWAVGFQRERLVGQASRRERA